MSRFSQFERRLSSLLAGAPRLRNALKGLYQRANFLINGDSGFRYSFSEGIALSTPSQISGVAEPSSEIAEFFGYFDASPWSPDGRFYVINQVRNAHAAANILLYDFQGGKRETIGTTMAWTWQQGAMPRWFCYKDENCLAYNAVEDGLLGTRICSERGEALQFLPLPLQAVNERFAKLYAINYLRLHGNGTEYGYALRTDNLFPDMPEDADGIWAVDLGSGQSELIVSLATLLQNEPRREMRRSVHEVNHISVAPDGRHFVFIHRWRGPSGQYSRLYLARHDGAELRLLLDDDMVSHYAWIDPGTIIIWARTRDAGDCYYLLDVIAGNIRPFPNDAVNRWGDGHPSVSPDGQMIVTDSYPDRKRQQHILIFDLQGSNMSEIGQFLLPMKYTGASRIDLHPRWSHDGNRISVDAGFPGVRRNYVLDFSASKHTA